MLFVAMFLGLTPCFLDWSWSPGHLLTSSSQGILVELGTVVAPALLTAKGMRVLHSLYWSYPQHLSYSPGCNSDH